MPVHDLPSKQLNKMESSLRRKSADKLATAEIAAQLRTMLGFHGRAGTRLAEIEWLLFRPANYGEYHGTSREHDLNQRRPLLYEHISQMSYPF